MKVAFRFASVVGLASVIMMMLSGPVTAAAPVMHAKNFAGYTAISATGITSFTGSLKVPTVKCPTAGSSNITVSVDLGSSSYQVLFGLQANCFNGSLNSLAASAIFCPSSGSSCGPSAGVSTAAGDSIQFSMSENKKTKTTTVSLTNSSEKQTASASVRSLLSQPDIGATTGFCCGNAQGNVTPIPSFTPISFGNLKFNSLILSSFSPARFNMYDGAVLQVATSSISSAGTFTTTFKHV
jgi:hypothetical protein